MALKRSPQVVHVGVPVPVPVPVMGPPTHPPIQRPRSGKKLDVYVGANNKRVPVKPILFAGFFAALGTALGIGQRKNILRGARWHADHMQTFFKWVSDHATKLIAK